MTQSSRSVRSAGADPTFDVMVEELANRLQAGEPVDLDSIAGGDPGRADALRALLPAMRRMAELGRSSAGTSWGSVLVHGADATAQEVGEFRVLREIGRGGMGVVYEAEQVSLGRRVALKVLPRASAFDPRQVARFKIESQTAAGLNHRHIVAVYAVGCDRGLNYFAMQLIDGSSLASVIRERCRAFGASLGPGVMPTGRCDGPIDEADAARPEASARTPLPEGVDAPGADGRASLTGLASEGPITLQREERGISSQHLAYFREAARLGAQAAEALEHAHAFGVVHRDVKPSNLLLDRRGQLWVTDFGLARLQDGADVTRTGDLVGTLRYMSPEQALGRRTTIDHRTDVYSLGATLYELLTLRPAFEGDEREDLLRRVVSEDPKPPRRIDPALSRDLEKIVLKAMRKEPEARYGSAGEMAADLHRYLEGRPVLARRPTLPERAFRWVGRHPAAVISVLLVLVVSLGALSSGTLIVSLERDKAIEQRKRADRRLDQARRLVDRLYTQVAHNRLENQPKMQGLQHELLQEALGFYRELIEEEGVDPGVRRETASAYFRVGEIVELLGRYAEAEEAYRLCLALRETLVAEFPDRDDLSDELASVLINLGNVARHGDRRAEFRALTGRAYDIRFALAARFSGNLSYRDALAYDVARYGSDFEEQDLGRYRLLLRRVFGPGLEPPPGTPMTPGYRRALAMAQVALWQFLSIAGRHEESEVFLRRSLTLYSGLVEEGIGTLEDRRLVAVCLDRFGWVFRLTGRQAELRKAFPRAMSAWDDLIADFPDVFPLRRDRAWSAAGFAWALSVRPVPGEDPARAVTLAREAVLMGPGDYGFRRSLGAALYRAGQFREAAAELAESERLNIKDGPDSLNEFFLAMVHARLGDADAARSWFDRAASLTGGRKWAEWEEHVLRDEAAAVLGLK
jgi:eukaryotic-like serine/threonine-protein kinase